MSKVWFRFSKRARNGELLHFRWENLTQHRFEEFVDFTMKYFVRDELTHIVAGIPENPAAMQEYRQLVSENYKDKSYYTSILCVDNNTSDMVGFSSLKLYKRGDIYENFKPAYTPEVKKFYHILRKWDNLCPVPDILDNYRVDRYFDDAFVAIQPDFRGYNMCNEISILRQCVSKSFDVPLTGAWMTSIATQRATKDWETIYEISPKELEKLLGLKFHEPPPMFRYKVKRVD